MFSVADDDEHRSRDPIGSPARQPSNCTSEAMKPVGGRDRDYTDGREPWDWKSRYPEEALKQMRKEAWILIGMLLGALLIAGLCLGFAEQPVSMEISFAKLNISFRLLAIFFTGCLGG